MGAGPPFALLKVGTTDLTNQIVGRLEFQAPTLSKIAKRGAAKVGMASGREVNLEVRHPSLLGYCRSQETRRVIIFLNDSHSDLQV